MPRLLGPEDSLFTLMPGSVWAGTVGGAGAGQSPLYLSVQPFPVATLGFLGAQKSQGNQARHLTSPQETLPERQEELPAA